MPNTIRRQIIENMVTTLDALPLLKGQTEVNAPDALDLDTAALPKAFIDSGYEEENQEEHELGSEAWKWQPVVSVYFRIAGDKWNYDAEDVAGEIHKALTADRSRGGLADECKRTSLDVVEIQTEYGLLQAIVSIWEIDYTHVQGDPYAQY